MNVSPSMVKELREKTGAGVMDCKKALEQSGGDAAAAIEYLRKKGLDKAAQKSGRRASEGSIGSYIHAGGKIGVLIELNCETDFVAKTDEFKNLLKDLSMHVAALNPKYVSISDVPKEVVEEREKFFAEQAEAEGKPPQVIEKIVQGKMRKFYEENCLLEQQFIKDEGTRVGELIKLHIAKIGENIVAKRFVRYQLGQNGGN